MNTRGCVVLMRRQCSSQAIKRMKNAPDLIKAVSGRNLLRHDPPSKTQYHDIASDSAVSQLPSNYDPKKIAAYFNARPFLMMRRLGHIGFASGYFWLKILGDMCMRRTKAKKIQRVGELRDILTSLGPFFVKLGQALSIRPDLLSPGAMMELQKLCDEVPPFDDDVALQLIESELERPIRKVFAELSPEPVAAASVGQGRLRRTNGWVAVKVQRPHVIATVSLDIHLLRSAGLLFTRLPFFRDRTNVVALLDEFATRFFEELDYRLECRNGIRLREHMKHIPEVTIPAYHPKYCTRRVLVCEWIDGEKLANSKANDVHKLVNVGIVAYLTQLLETGFLHADPHPGNLIRTRTGKLALLDFGLMTSISDDVRFGLIEGVSHAMLRDYHALAEDFVKLGFIPRNFNAATIVPDIKRIFEATMLQTVNFQRLIVDLAQLSYKYPFRIPAYFTLIIRAIGVLEGIALVDNPNFVIVNEAYPYIVRRLFSDPSPRLHSALRSILYDAENVLDIERLINMLNALEVMETHENTGSEHRTRRSLQYLFSPDGEFVRQFLVAESCRAVDAISRISLWDLWYTLGGKHATSPRIIRQLIPPPERKDRKYIESVNRLLDYFSALNADTSSSQIQEDKFVLLSKMLRIDVRRAKELSVILQEYSPHVRSFCTSLLYSLLSKTTDRLFDYISDSCFSSIDMNDVASGMNK